MKKSALLAAGLLLHGAGAVRGRGREITIKHGGAIEEDKHTSAKIVKSVQNTHSQSEFALTHAAEMSMIEQMSVSHALEIIGKLKGSKPEVVNAIQSQLKVVKAAVSNLRQKQPDGGVAAAQAAGSYGSGAQKALTMLNEMLLEAIEKMDFEVVRCDGEERTNLAALAQIREDIIMFNAMAAGAATTMNKAKGDMTRFTGLLEDTKTEFKTNVGVCNVERKDLEGKIKVVSSDLAVMKIVVGMTDCGDSAQATLFQCVDTKTNRTWTEMRPGQKLKEAISKVDSV